MQMRGDRKNIVERKFADKLLMSCYNNYNNENYS